MAAQAQDSEPEPALGTVMGDTRANHPPDCPNRPYWMEENCECSSDGKEATLDRR